MHPKSDDTEIMIDDKVDKIIEKLFLSLLFRYQIGLETSIKGSEFVLNVFLYCIINITK